MLELKDKDRVYRPPFIIDCDVIGKSEFKTNRISNCYQSPLANASLYLVKIIVACQIDADIGESNRYTILYDSTVSLLGEKYNRLLFGE